MKGSTRYQSFMIIREQYPYATLIKHKENVTKINELWNIYPDWQMIQIFLSKTIFGFFKKWATILKALSHNKQYFLHLVSQFCCSVARQVAQDIAQCNTLCHTRQFCMRLVLQHNFQKVARKFPVLQSNKGNSTSKKMF